MKSNEYKCAQCKRVFEKGWTEEEARQEQKDNGWGNIDDEEMDLICDDCYQATVN